MAHRRTRHSILHTAVANATARLKGLRYRKVGLVPVLLIGGGALLLFSVARPSAPQRRGGRVAGLGDFDEEFDGLGSFGEAEAWRRWRTLRHPQFPPAAAAGASTYPVVLNSDQRVLNIGRADYAVPSQLTPWDRGAEIRQLIALRLPVNKITIDTARNRLYGGIERWR